MGTITDALALAFRDYVTDGIPASGANDPDKAQVRAVGPVIESALVNIALGAMVSTVQTTRAALNATLGFPAGAVGLVYSDPTDANNDIYVKVGASGSGSWTLTSTFHTIIQALAQPYVTAASGFADDAEGFMNVAQAIASKIEPYPHIFANQVTFVDGGGRLGPDIVLSTGRVVASLQAQIQAVSADVYSAVGWLTDYIGQLWYGQSLAIGTTGAGSLISTTPVPGGKRFSVGVRPQDSGSEDPAAWGTIADLIETISPVASNLRETCAAGFVQRINERLTRDFGINMANRGQAFFCSAPGEGGMSWEDLDDPSTYWTRLVNTMQKQSDLSAGASRSWRMGALNWVQGEANQNDTASEYYDGVKAIWDDAQAAAQAISGTADPLMFCTYQTSSWPAVGWNDPLSADAYLWLHERNTYGLFACPIYHLPYADSYHLTPAGYKTLGAYFADVQYDFVISKFKRPVLRPVITRVAANVIKLTYPLIAGSRLVFDTSVTTARGATIKQHGLRIASREDNLDEDPASEIDCIVTLTGAAEITMTGVADIPSGYILRQAWDGDLQRVYSEIRDTAGSLRPRFDPSGLNVAMHNWIPTCMGIIP